jgi:hypothetical protein
VSLDAGREAIELDNIGHRAAVEDVVELDAHRQQLLVMHRVGYAEDLSDSSRVVWRDGSGRRRIDLQLCVLGNGRLQRETRDGWMGGGRVCQSGQQSWHKQVADLPRLEN